MQYETPENVQLSYTIAGPGSRLLAWFVDNLLIVIFMFLLGLAFVFFSVVSSDVISDALDRFFATDDPAHIGMILSAIWLLLWGLGSFAYYTLFELWMRGQTPGKRTTNIRVVKVNGFTLDPTSIFIRNIFRVIDQIPVLWIVPMANGKHQRFGDMVGGTLVVSDEQLEMHPLRAEILAIPTHEVRFRFPGTALQKLTPEQITGIEQVCERWGTLDTRMRTLLMGKILPGLVEQLKVDPPEKTHEYQFLTDLLHAEYRRQERMLG